MALSLCNPLPLPLPFSPSYVDRLSKLWCKRLNASRGTFHSPPFIPFQPLFSLFSAPYSLPPTYDDTCPSPPPRSPDYLLDDAAAKVCI